MNGEDFAYFAWLRLTARCSGYEGPRIMRWWLTWAAMQVEWRRALSDAVSACYD